MVASPTLQWVLTRFIRFEGENAGYLITLVFGMQSGLMVLIFVMRNN
jgi:hypothetical protein